MDLILNQHLLTEEHREVLTKMRGILQSAEQILEQIQAKKGTDSPTSNKAATALKNAYALASVLIENLLIYGAPVNRSELVQLEKLAYDNPDDDPEQAKRRLDQTGRYSRKLVVGNGSLPSDEAFGEALDELFGE